MSFSLTGKPDLSPARKALLQRLLKQQGITSSEPEKKPVQPGKLDSAPLSFAQQRIWFLHQLEPAGSAFHILSGMRLQGTLHIDALETSLHEIIDRHQILRTTFPVVAGSPVQQVGEPTPVRLEPVDLSHLSAQEWHQEIVRLIRVDKDTPFDLAHGPLLRVYCFRTGPTGHVLLLSFHHIVIDGQSIGMLLQELAVLYEAHVTEKASPLPALTWQYADFALWQRERLQGTVLEEQIQFWVQQLSDRPAPLALPTDQPRRSQQAYLGRTRTLAFSPELSRKLSELARREGVTMVMLILATFQVLLARYSGGEDIAVGLPVVNRMRTEFEPLLGNFLNTLVMRANLRENPTFRELLQQVRTNALEAYSHQDAPFEQVVEALRPERDTSRTVLFQALFTFQNAYREQTWAGLTCPPFEMEGQGSYDEE